MKRLIRKWLGLEDIQSRLDDAIKHWNESIAEHNEDCPRFVNDLVEAKIKKEFAARLLI